MLRNKRQQEEPPVDSSTSGLMRAFGRQSPFPTRPSQRRARNDDFSFKSATKLRPQMVYELNEKSTI